MSTETFAHNLRKFREVRKWTQEDLARASGVSRRTISRYEWGGVKPRAASLLKLADALGCTVELLWTGRESPNRRRGGRRNRALELVMELQGTAR